MAQNDQGRLMPAHLLHALEDYLTGYIMAARGELLRGGESMTCKRGWWDRWEVRDREEIEYGS